MTIFSYVIEPFINETISRTLKRNSHNVIDASNSKKTSDMIHRDGYDFYILELNSKDSYSFDIITYIREVDAITPIIIINGSDDINIIERAYELGCTEYLKKPFHVNELKIKIDKIFGPNAISSIIHFTDDFYYNAQLKTFYYNEEPIKLRYKESRFCEILIKNLNTPLYHDIIENYVWNDTNKTSYPLRQLVSLLRKKLPYDIIKNIHKVGYLITTQKE